MNHVAVATYFDGTEGLLNTRGTKTVTAIAAIARRGDKHADTQLCRWAYENKIKDLEVRSADGKHVAWILQGKMPDGKPNGFNIRKV